MSDAPIPRKDYELVLAQRDAAVRERDRMFAERNCLSSQLQYARQQLHAQRTLTNLPAELILLHERLSAVMEIAQQAAAHLATVCQTLGAGGTT